MDKFFFSDLTLSLIDTSSDWGGTSIQMDGNKGRIFYLKNISNSSERFGRLGWIQNC